MSQRSLTLLACLLLSICALRARPAAAAPADFRGADGPYLRAVHFHVHPLWSARKQAGAPGAPVELIVGIEPTGVVATIEQIVRAGDPPADESPGALLRSLSRVDPPPPALRSDDGRVYLFWRFTRRPPGCEQMSVIHRRLPLREALPRLVQDGRSDEAVARIREEEAVPERRRELLLLLAGPLGRWAAGAPAAEHRQAAAAILAHVPDGEPALAALLQDPERGVRLAALSAMTGRQGPPEASVPALRQLLGSEDRAAAALLLAQKKDRDALPALRAALLAGEQPAETAAALRTLGDRVEAARVTARLLAAAETAPAGAAAARALGDPALLRPLLNRYRAGPPELREALLPALSAMGPRAPAEAKLQVMRAMTDPSPEVRRRAMEAAAGFSDHARAFRYRLIDALKDPEPAVRAAAVRALVEVGGKEAHDDLIVAARDPEVPVRAALLQALRARPQDYDGAEPLMDKLRRDPAVERAAAVLSTPPGPGEPPRRELLLSSRVVTLRAVSAEEQAAMDRLVRAADLTGRLRATAAWIAMTPR